MSSSERERNGRQSRSRSPRISRSRSRSPRRRGDGVDGGGSHRGRRFEEKETKMVYISNIPYDVRWMELKDLVREKAGDVSFVEVIEKDGKSKGCAVVEFKDRESTKKCVENMHRMQMKDRFVVVKEIRDPERFFKKIKEETGVDFSANKSGPLSLMGFGGGGGGGGGSGQFSGHSSGPVSLLSGATQLTNYETYGLSPVFLKQLGIDGPLCNRVFIANLSFTIGSSKLKEVFSLAGQVTDVDMQIDKEGKPKGLAVVEFSHPIEAVQAVSMLHNQKLHDRLITVKMDRFEKLQDNRRPGELPVGLKHVGMGLGTNGAPLNNVSQLVQAGVLKPFNANPPSIFNTNIFGGTGSGLSNSVLEAARIFDSPILNSLTSGGGSGSGGGSLSAALGSGVFSGSLLGGNGGGGSSSLYGSSKNLGSLTGGGSASSLGYENRLGYESRSAASQLGSLLSGGGGGGDFDRHYGRSNSPAMGRSIRLSKTVILRNLPLDYSWQTLRDRMRGFGDVEFSDIIQPGVGKIRFKTASDAEKAVVSLHGMIVEGRQISVDLSNSD